MIYPEQGLDQTPGLQTLGCFLPGTHLTCKCFDLASMHRLQTQKNPRSLLASRPCLAYDLSGCQYTRPRHRADLVP